MRDKRPNHGRGCRLWHSIVSLDNMHFVTTPTRAWLREAIARCRNDIIIASPFVGSALNIEIEGVSAKVTRTLITRTELTTFASRASDLEALVQFSQSGGEVRSLPGLHAKVYIIDQTVALVTSANATFSGLGRNWECGVVVDGSSEVEELVQIVNGGFGSPIIPQKWACADLKSLRPAVDVMRQRLQAAEASHPLQMEDSVGFEVPIAVWQEVYSTLPGWTQMTLRAVLALKSEEFEIDQIYRVGLPLASSQYPQNKSPKEKLRQQLQRLRDLGIIEFLGGGRYRLLAKAL